jgi:aspartate oxidase
LIEKGEIINDAGEDIVEKYALSGVRPLAIRGRDRLSTALFKENIQGRKAYLDIGRVRVDDSSLESSDREMLRVLEDRYQSATRRLPVMPCAHFTIGGVVIDEHCRTSREGLFAAGEVACGLHGANRMGGNALTETLVFGCRAGNRAAVFSADSRPDKPYKVDVRHMLERMGNDAAGRHLPASALKSIRQIMWENCGPVRDSTGLSLALDRVRKLKEEGIRCESPRDLGLAYSVGNCLDTAIMVIKGAIERKASMGAHRPGVDCAPQSGPRGR